MVKVHKLSLLLPLILVSRLALSQSCLPDGIGFHDQESIDQFQFNYPGCTVIEGNVNIDDYCYNIKNLDGLSVITSIGGDLVIGNTEEDGNTQLTNLDGLQNLASIGGSLTIAMNKTLVSITGLNNLSPASISNLNITYNTSLSSCQARFLCDYLASPNGVVDIHDNAAGCNTPPEIASSCGISLPCLPFGNYYFTRQADIDNFPSDYSNCTRLGGNTLITGDNITNLNGLLSITAVGGNLSIYNADLLNNVDGLVNIDSIGKSLSFWSLATLDSINGFTDLTYIGGRLVIAWNDSLKSLAGFRNLKTIGEWFDVLRNDRLTTLEGLENLDSIGFYFKIYGNKSLRSLEGLDNLDHIGGFLSIQQNNILADIRALQNITSIKNGLYIDYNDSLASLSGLENLASIGGSLRIEGNSALVNLDVLQNLSSIGINDGGGIDISYNASLSNLDGLANIAPGTIKGLEIDHNEVLSDCDALSICQYLVAPVGFCQIYDNANGCNSKQEVIEACGVGLDEPAASNSQYIINLYPNPSYSVITVETLTEPGKNTILAIYDLEGRQVIKRPVKEKQTQFDLSGLSRGVYFYKVRDDQAVQTGKLVRQ